MNLNKAQLIIFGFIGIVVILMLLLLLGALPGLKAPAARSFTLEVWGLADPPEIWQEITRAYQEKASKSAAINYVSKDPKTYEAELLDALASGQGPDVFLIKDSWIEKHKAKIKPLSEGELGYEKKNLKSIFADAIAGAISDETGALLGTPLGFDTLSLFYNRDFFNSANIPSPPRTWEEFSADARALTKLSELGGITRSGAAMGIAANVEHSADILMAFIFQSGGSVIKMPENPAEKPQSAVRNPATASALSFFISFSDTTKRTYSWNSLFRNSIEALAKSETAMAFGYAKDVRRIFELNPQLNFDTAPLPQTDLAKPQVNYGRFDLLTVSRLSKEPEEAWKFLLWLQEKDIHKKYIDLVGLAPARRDLVQSKPPREWLAPFYDQVLSASVFPLAGDDSLAKIISDMIEAVQTRRFSVDQAMSRAENEINALLRPQQ